MGTIWLSYSANSMRKTSTLEHCNAIADVYYSEEYRILKQRNPTNGTKAAYIDFYNKQAAWEASHGHKSIFGLKLRVRLAKEVFKTCHQVLK
jgi:hypothetical protein